MTVVAPRVLVMLREPVERTISFYYERIYQSWEAMTKGKQRAMNLNDLPLEDLEFLLGHFYGSAWSRYRDEGLADTACKMLCGLNVHKGRTPEQVAQHQQHQQQDPAAARSEVDAALADTADVRRCWRCGREPALHAASSAKVVSMACFRCC